MGMKYWTLNFNYKKINLKFIFNINFVNMSLWLKSIQIKKKN